MTCTIPLVGMSKCSTAKKKNNMVVREIQPGDNAGIAEVIRDVLIHDMGAPKKGTAYEDPSVDFMYEAYSAERSVYFVIADEGTIIGGGGIAALAGGDGTVCELQKMYFRKQARGLGLGRRIMELCLDKARDFRFEHCYIETMPYMEAAQQLYLKSGFRYLDAPMGNTGHSSCPVWMLKTL